MQQTPTPTQTPTQTEAPKKRGRPAGNTAPASSRERVNKARRIAREQANHVTEFDMASLSDAVLLQALQARVATLRTSNPESIKEGARYVATRIMAVLTDRYNLREDLTQQ